MIHFRRFVKRGIYRLQTAEEDYHLITHALPCAHYRYRGQRLICAVNERLRVEAHVCEQRVEYALGTVNLHPQSGNNRKRHNNGNEKCDFEILFAVCYFVYQKRKSECAQTLQGNDDDNEFYRVQKRSHKEFVAEEFCKVFKTHKVSCVRAQCKIVGKAVNKRQHHRQKQENRQQYKRGTEKRHSHD